MFGQGATAGGIGFQFRFIKVDAKLLVDAADQGIDTTTVQVPSGKKCIRRLVLLCLGAETSPTHTQHSFTLKRVSVEPSAEIVKHLAFRATEGRLKFQLHFIKQDARALA